MAVFLPKLSVAHVKNELIWTIALSVVDLSGFDYLLVVECLLTC
jgi:hypothetical protein